MNQWKSIRMKRLCNEQTQKMIIIPMDHGLTDGPVGWLESPAYICQQLLEWWADAVLWHTWILRHGYTHVVWSGRMWNILQLAWISWVTEARHRKQCVHSVEDAVRMWCDAVSYHINLGNEFEYEMIRDFGRVCNDAYMRGMPVLAMVYARGPLVEEKWVKDVAHSARFAAEMWADIVKVPYTWDIESMKTVVAWCPIPVVISGWSSLSDEETLHMIHWAMASGCMWLSMGRNIFGKQDPAQFLKAVTAIVHDDATVQEAMTLLK